MDDKVFILMEKMYIEFSTRFDKVEDRFDKVEGRFDEVENRFDKIEERLTNMENVQFKLENDLSEKFGILSDAQKVTNERLDKIDAKVDALIDQVGVHEVQIKLLKKVVE